jgi:hypothetical protein
MDRHLPKVETLVEVLCFLPTDAFLYWGNTAVDLVGSCESRHSIGSILKCDEHRGLRDRPVCAQQHWVAKNGCGRSSNQRAPWQPQILVPCGSPPVNVGFVSPASELCYYESVDYAQ